MKPLFFVAAAMAVLATSCQVNYEKTKSGLVYKIIPGKGGEQLQPDRFIKFNMEYAMPEKDTVLNSTYGKVPGYTQVDTGKNVSYSFMEILPLCKVGDSIQFSMSVDTLKNRKALPEYNNTFKRGDQIKCKMSILKMFSNENDVKADYEKEVAVQKDREVNDLQSYLSKKGIKTQKTKNGAFVEIENAGDAASKADSGKMVTIMYKGYFQSSGKVFDTNMDTSKGHNQPINLVMGRGQVIPGWEEGLPYFGKGGKGKIYVPSMLAYGMQGSPGAIPPYSNLIFDVEIRDVKNAPAEAAQPNPSGLTPEQMQQLQQMQQQQQQSPH